VRRTIPTTPGRGGKESPSAQSQLSSSKKKEGKGFIGKTNSLNSKRSVYFLEEVLPLFYGGGKSQENT